MTLALNPRISFLLKGPHAVHQVTCWRITRTDGIIKRLTDHAHTVTFNSEVFTPVGGIEISARRREIGLKGHDVEVVGLLTTAEISQTDLVKGLYDDATVEDYIVNPMYPWAGQVKMSEYRISNLQYTDEFWSMDARSLTSVLDTRIGRKYEHLCDWDLFDSNCKVVRADWKVSGAVVAGVTSRSLFDAVDAGIPATLPGPPGAPTHTVADGTFDHGELVWLTGSNSGITSEVAIYTHTDAIFQLFNETPFNITAGDSFDVFAGCDKRFKDDGGHCVNKFVNKVNFGGFPWMPGSDKVLNTPPV